ncbi:hypothetical protein ABKV19_027584 [Rosa sericea]
MANEEHCWEWARKYLGYNLCSTKDGVSLVLGVVSVASWGVAEVPQIITNFKHKSTDGLSLAFLITWIVGDLFNLFGCMLEPATLPTQYYTAMLYTVTTITLSVQTIYYGYIHPRLKYNSRHKKDSKSDLTEVPGKSRGSNSDFFGNQVDIVGRSNAFDTSSRGNVLSSPISLPPSKSPRRESYYISARSLSRSHTPTEGSHLAQKMTGTYNRIRNSNEEPLLGSLASRQSAPTNVKTVLCVVSLMTLFGTFNYRSADNKGHLIVDSNPGVVMLVGRKLLQVHSGLLQEKGVKGSSVIGHVLGWGMAAIYIGGRFPQIFLNFKRSNVEGLNPLMFIFAIVGNATYVASIVVNSLEWSKIRPNLAWLVDAGGCMFLDIFILIQFIYFRYWRQRELESKGEDSSAA